jgi:hypothetical protein
MLQSLGRFIAAGDLPQGIKMIAEFHTPEGGLIFGPQTKETEPFDFNIQFCYSRRNVMPHNLLGLHNYHSSQAESPSQRYRLKRSLQKGMIKYFA